jgi:5'-nucleotidase
VVTDQGRRNTDALTIEDRMDTRGKAYYWLGFKRRKTTPKEGSDLWAVYTGRISITPLNLNLTHRNAMKDLALALAE